MLVSSRKNGRKKNIRLKHDNPRIIKEERLISEATQATVNGSCHDSSVQIDDDIHHFSHNPFHLLQKDTRQKTMMNNKRILDTAPPGTPRPKWPEAVDAPEEQQEVKIITINQLYLYKTRSKDHFQGLQRTLTEHKDMLGNAPPNTLF
jgi:hypothetical protein